MGPDRENIWFSGNLMTVLHSEGWTLIESHMRAGHAPPLHIHRLEDEAFYILEGSMSLRRGDEVRELAAGDAIVVERGTPHAFRVGPGGVKALQIATGPGLAAFIREAGEPALTATLPDEGHIDHGAVARTAERHDMVIIGESLP